MCARCHARHTSHGELLPLAALTDENIGFAVQYLGVGPAYEYFTRYYGGTDARVDALLEQL